MFIFDKCIPDYKVDTDFVALFVSKTSKQALHIPILEEYGFIPQSS
jgi:hypothetical protein